MSVLPASIAVCGSIAGGVIDLRTGLIPNRLTRTTALVATGCAAAGGDAVAALLGALAGGALLFALHALTGGRGLGYGDVKMGLAIGAGFGPAGALVAIGTSFVLGGAYAGWLLASRRATRGETIAFGPFLAAGSCASALALVAAAHGLAP